MSRGEGVRRAARGKCQVLRRAVRGKCEVLHRAARGKCEVLRRAARGAGQGGAAPLGAARLTPRDIWGQKMGAGA